MTILNSQQSRRNLRRLAIVLIGSVFAHIVSFCVAEDSASKQNRAARVDFVRGVQPLLRRHCYRCHAGVNDKGGLKLSTRAVLSQAADSGEVVIQPGQPDKSLLIQRLTDGDYGDIMPLDGEPLAAADIATLRNWIQQGADWPRGLQEDQHWAYVKPTRPGLPVIKQDQHAVNAVDRFVIDRLESAGLAPSPEADRAILLRRASLALTGLPPTATELEKFLADDSPQAYESAVDRLLASPQYGERWAQQWLDLARYADSNGFQADQLRDSWAYRDWVIRAFNRDQPFDAFVIDQLAGDLLPSATVEQKIATGFHRTPTCNVEAGVHPEENRINQVFDRVNTTGTVFLGTSLECCQCHDHKYDPFSQAEYYQIFAFFNNTPLEVKKESGVQFNFFGPSMELPLERSQQQRRDGLRAELRSLQKQMEELRQQRLPLLAAWELQLQESLAKNPPTWQPVTPTEFASTGKETHRTLEDGSILVGGPVPGVTTYTLTFRDLPPQINGFKIECLTHDELPGRGPGRGDKVRTNFILSEVQATLNGADRKPASRREPVRKISLTEPSADFSQQGWPVENAIDGDTKTGWAINPQFGRDHHAVFLTASPVKPLAEETLQLKLVQNYGQGRTIGRVRISLMTGDADSQRLPENIRKIITKRTANRKDDKAKERKSLEDYFVGLDPEFVRLQRDIKQRTAELTAIKPDSTLVMIEMEQPRETRLLERGNYLTPGDTVNAGTPQTLHALPAGSPANRLGFARWLTSRENPLLARVTVNRWWAACFGQGLVATPEDFGTQGERPTHPELLDWLAVEFMESGWSMKHVHKLIVMSATFRQSSRVTPKLLAADPENRLLARGPRFRLPAEFVRDNALRIAGVLSEKMYGPPIMPYQPDGLWKAVGRNQPKWVTATDENRFRRGLYVVWKRGAPYPGFVNFDAPDRASCTVQRPRTNTPLQALTLLNDPAYAELSVALAQRILKESSSADINARLTLGFRLCTAREPSGRELAVLRRLHQQETAVIAANPALAKQRIQNLLPRLRDADLPADELAVWVAIANVLLNLDETITLH